MGLAFTSPLVFEISQLQSAQDRVVIARNNAIIVRSEHYELVSMRDPRGQNLLRLLGAIEERTSAGQIITGRKPLPNRRSPDESWTKVQQYRMCRKEVCLSSSAPIRQGFLLPFSGGRGCDIL